MNFPASHQAVSARSYVILSYTVALAGNNQSSDLGAEGAVPAREGRVEGVDCAADGNNSPGTSGRPLKGSTNDDASCNKEAGDFHGVSGSAGARAAKVVPSDTPGSEVFIGEDGKVLEDVRRVPLLWNASLQEDCGETLEGGDESEQEEEPKPEEVEVENAGKNREGDEPEEKSKPEELGPEESRPEEEPKPEDEESKPKEEGEPEESETGGAAGGTGSGHKCLKPTTVPFSLYHANSSST